MIRPRFVAALLIALIVAVVVVIVSLLPAPVEQAQPVPKGTPSVPEPTFAPVVYSSKPPDPRELPPDAPCEPIHFGFDGNPARYRGKILGRYRVPPGREWNLTNASVMMERHHGGAFSQSGEWTGVIGGIVRGERVAFAISSLDTHSGIALQGQGRLEVTLPAGSELIVSIWLRPYTGDAAGNRVPTDPANYYYTIAASGMDCPTRLRRT